MKFNIFIKQYKYDLISFLVNFLSAYFAFIYKDESNSLIVFWISIVIFILSIILIIYLRTKEKDFYYLCMDKFGLESNWVGRGNFKFVKNEKCYEITNSHVGYIFPKTILWDDYIFQFEFKITYSCIGWIVRATNLSNYLMFQCGLDGINPHIRVNGHWPIIQKHTDLDANFSFKKHLSLDEWYNAKIICEKRSVRIKIYNNKKIYLDRYWEIPDIIPVNLLSLDKQKIMMNYEMDYDYGAVGFRDSGKEKALIKNIYIERL